MRISTFSGLFLAAYLVLGISVSSAEEDLDYLGNLDRGMEDLPAWQSRENGSNTMSNRNLQPRSVKDENGSLEINCSTENMIGSYCSIGLNFFDFCSVEEPQVGQQVHQCSVAHGADSSSEGCSVRMSDGPMQEDRNECSVDVLGEVPVAQQYECSIVEDTGLELSCSVKLAADTNPEGSCSVVNGNWTNSQSCSVLANRSPQVFCSVESYSENSDGSCSVISSQGTCSVGSPTVTDIAGPPRCSTFLDIGQSQECSAWTPNLENDELTANCSVLIKTVIGVVSLLLIRLQNPCFAPRA